MTLGAWIIQELTRLRDEVQSKPETDYGKAYIDAVDYMIDAIEEEAWRRGIDLEE
jgi:hypothetical protein